MSKVGVHSIGDPDHPEGGHIIIEIHGLEKVPDGVDFLIRPAGDAYAGEVPAGWPNGHIYPISAKPTSNGVAFGFGPDIVNSEFLLPGTPVQIEIPNLGIQGQFIWPNVQPLRQPKRRNLAVNSQLRHARTALHAVPPQTDGARPSAPAAEPTPLSATPKPDIGDQTDDASPVPLRQAEAAVIESFDLDAGHDVTATGSPAHVRDVPPTPAEGAHSSRLIQEAEEAQATLSRLMKAPKADEVKPITANPGDGPLPMQDLPRRAPMTAGRSPALNGLHRKGLHPKGLESVANQASFVRSWIVRQRPVSLAPGLHMAVLALLVPFFLISPDRLPGWLRHTKVAVAPGTFKVAQPLEPAGNLPFDLSEDDRPNSLFDSLTAGTISPNGVAATDLAQNKVLENANRYLGSGSAADREEGSFWRKRYVLAVLGADRTKRALTQLGSLYAEPSGQAPDFSKARMLWEIASAAGDPVAMCFLGQLHENGLSVPADKKGAFQWYERAKRAGGCPAVDDALARVRQ